VNNKPEVTQLRLVVTTPDYEQAPQFYRDVPGLPEHAAYLSRRPGDNPGGRPRDTRTSEPVLSSSVTT
jgi:catechol 2,3-dioxygenase-like lactoylglutathione lyase family enzyme